MSSSLKRKKEFVFYPTQPFKRFKIDRPPSCLTAITFFFKLDQHLQCLILSFLNESDILRLYRLSPFFRLLKQPYFQNHYRSLFIKQFKDTKLVPVDWVKGWATQSGRLCLYCQRNVDGYETFYRVAICSDCHESHDSFHTIGTKEAFTYCVSSAQLSSIKRYVCYGQSVSTFYRAIDVKRLALQVHGTEDAIERAQEERCKRLLSSSSNRNKRRVRKRMGVRIVVDTSIESDYSDDDEEDDVVDTIHPRYYKSDDSDDEDFK